MDSLVIVLLGVLILLVIIMIALAVILLSKNKNKDTEIMLHSFSKEINKDLNDYSSRILENTNTRNLELQLEKQMNQFSQSINQVLIKNNNDSKDSLHQGVKEISNDFIRFQDRILKSIELKLNQIDDKVNQKLTDGFQKTNETFKEIVERISKIDEAQRNIEKLSGEVVSLQDILSDKKSRGAFGEVELRQILVSIYGESNNKIYNLQFKLSTGVVADAVLYTPEPLGLLCIDSKFPLENYRKMLDKKYSDSEREAYSKMFKNDVKHHIDTIASKYIIKNETAEQAVMFLPSEAIFAEIHAYYPEIVDYAYKCSVWITAPTTLMAFLSTIQLTLTNIERNKYTKVIHQELERLAVEFSRYKARWDKLKHDIDSVSKDVSEIHITTEKISTKFDKINKVDLDDDHLIENNNYLEEK